MSERINRREFSGLMAGGMALLSEAAPAWAQPAGTISVRQTADTKRFAEEPVLKWQPAEVLVGRDNRARPLQNVPGNARLRRRADGRVRLHDQPARCRRAREVLARVVPSVRAGPGSDAHLRRVQRLRRQHVQL